MRRFLAFLLVCALLQAPTAEASVSLGAYALNEQITSVGFVRVRLFDIHLSGPQPLVVSVLSDDFEPLVYLVSPDKRVWPGDEPADGRASISIGAAAPGSWYLAVRSAGPPSGGGFALAVNTADPVPIGPTLPPDAEVAAAALHLWFDTRGPAARDGYAGDARGLRAPGEGAPPLAARPAPSQPAGAEPKLLAPLLPWPPPEPSARMVVPKQLLGNPATLGELDDRLRVALSRAGYDDVGYFAVPDGFAAVTRLERTDKAGKSVTGASRWEMAVPGVMRFDLLSYLKALLMAQTGYFRVIAFVVTSVPFTASVPEVEAVSAQRWAQSGQNALTVALRSQPFTTGYSVTALVYEFSKARGEHTVHFHLPGDLTATTHLEAAGILAALQN